MLDLIYICDTRFPSFTANSIHIARMADAFLSTGKVFQLIAPISTKKPLEEKGRVDSAGKFYGSKLFENPLYIYRRPGKFGKFLYLTAALLKSKNLNARVIYTRDLTAAFFAVLFGFQTVLESHYPISKEGVGKRIIFNIVTLFNNFLGLSVITQSLRNSYAISHPKISGKIIVAPDAALQNFNNKDYELKGNRLTVGYVGGLYKGKGVEVIIEVAKLNPHHHFRIFGGTEEHIRYWRSMCQSPNVEFCGFVEPANIQAVYSEIDVALLPNQASVIVGHAVAKDGNGQDIGAYTSPLKLFEYMAAGLPIISSDLEVIREVVTQNEVIFAPPSDFSEWSNALTRFESKEIRQFYGRNAKSKFNGAYTWDIRAKRISDFFEI